jgi:imidazolonepropionase-like amidohydrolase
VKLVAGSDFTPFMSRPAGLLRELQLFARAGVPGGEVIAAGTRRVAEKIGKDKTAGTISAGSVADALLVAADPIADVNVLVRAAQRIATVRAGALHATADQ